jgi:hypothetical protein
MLKCSTCGKKITDKEKVKFTWLALIYPKVYCSNKCIFAARKIDPYLNQNQGQPMKLKSNFIILLIFTLIIFLFSAYILANSFWNLDVYTIVLLISALVLWIILLNMWRMHFWVRRQMNKIK